MGGKMSASEDKGKIGLHEGEKKIVKKMNQAWCEQGKVEGNGVLALAKHLVFQVKDELVIERPDKFGGNLVFKNYEEMESAFAKGELHPADLKGGLGKAIADLLKPCRERLAKNPELIEKAY